MELLPEYIDRFLPFGDSLKELVRDSNVSTSDVKNLLRSRGVITDNTEAGTLYPILATTIFSPKEFDFIRGKLRAKEDNEKMSTRTVQWVGDKSTPLLHALPKDLKLNELINSEDSRFKIVTTSSFVPVQNNPDKLELRYKVERNDFTKSWYRNKNSFEGKVQLERVKDSKGDKLEIQMMYTASETKLVAEKLTKRLEKSFKDSGHVSKNETVKKIRFMDFTNEERIKFFWKLTGDSVSDVFEFQKIRNIEFGPDEDEIILPEDIAWMQEGKVNVLGLKGDTLQNTFYVTNEEYFKYFLFAEMEVQFKFSLENVSGRCIIRFGFPRFFYRKDVTAEFEVIVKRVYLDSHCKMEDEHKIASHLLREFETFKIETYNLFKYKELAGEYTPPTA